MGHCREHCPSPSRFAAAVASVAATVAAGWGAVYVLTSAPVILCAAVVTGVAVAGSLVTLAVTWRRHRLVRTWRPAQAAVPVPVKAARGPVLAIEAPKVLPDPLAGAIADVLAAAEREVMPR